MVYDTLFTNSNMYYGLIGICLVWSLILTILLTSYIFHYRQLVKKTGKKELKAVLNEILRMVQQNQKDLMELEKNQDKIEKDSLRHLQKVGFLRFNPFSDTGGDQSFILAVLSGKGDGMVLSSLHSRGTTRLYAKEIVKGKSKTFKLSKEEQEVVQKLLKKSNKVLT